jgi:hypothetical protein
MTTVKFILAIMAAGAVVSIIVLIAERKLHSKERQSPVKAQEITFLP